MWRVLFTTAWQSKIYISCRMSKTPTHNQAVKKLIESQKEQLADLEAQLEKTAKEHHPRILEEIKKKEEKIVKLGGKIIKRIQQSPGFSHEKWAAQHLGTGLHNYKPKKGGRRTRRKQRKTRKTRMSRR